MSTSSVSSNPYSSSGLTVSSLAGGSTQQITGLASGLNTNQIITAEMAIYNQPVVNLQNQQKGITAQNSALAGIQSELQTLVTDAQALGTPSLFANTQSVSSSDPTRVTATSTGGAGVGGYQVAVSQLANAAQRTFTFTSPTGTPDNITIDNQPVTIGVGQSASDFANAVNANSKLDVYAAATSSGQIVFSNRQTGAAAAGYINVQDSQGALVEQPGLAYAGQDAAYTINGSPTTQYSHSNTVANAIAGVSLTFTGVTTTTGPVTVNVGPPAPSSSNISAALNAFTTQYNKVIGDMQTQLSTPPSQSDPTVGTLYGDPQLQGLLTTMRSAMYQAQNPGSTSAIQSMLDVGVSTGTTTGNGAVSKSALSGTLKFNSSTLTAALQSDPAGLQQMLVGFSATFSTSVGANSDPGGSMDARIQGDSRQISELGNRISAMQATLADKQNQLVQQFAQLEAALSSNQSEASWLTNQIAALPGA